MATMARRIALLVWLLASVALASPSVACPQMKAGVYTSRPVDLKFDLQKVDVIDTDVPKLGDGEVLVQVHASSINPMDHKIVEEVGIGWWSFPHKLGFDLAGVVSAVGPGCNRLKVGDEVWGSAMTLLETLSTSGTFAQYAAVSESVLGVKPPSLTMAEAGAMPLVTLAGYDSLKWAAMGPKFSGDNVTVLVLGGSGGTGHMGIQLAKAMGAKKVITTCSGSHTKFVQSFGADQVIDYHKEKYYEVLAPKSVDVVYDCVGLSGTGDHAFGILKDHGRFATLVPQTALPSIKARFQRPDISTYPTLCVGPCTNHDRIDALAGFVKQGKLKVHIDTTYDLENIRQAFNHSFGHASGKKSALRISDTTSTTATPRQVQQSQASQVLV